ncbi:MAG: type III pantothenate kinase [Candidatus Goldbacteria bacterium]|nr:type III pantothenate kinase [Candidatus Goldiibacteriota bacterium]
MAEETISKGYVLVLDVGNSNITAGVFSQDNLLFSFRLRTNINLTEDQYYTQIKQLLEINKTAVSDIKGAIVGSVVPVITESFTGMIKKYFGFKPVTIGPKTKLNIKNKYRNKNEVGDDRLANAAKAYNVNKGKDTIIIDLGTSINFDVLDKKGNFLGGAIMPGIYMSLHALFARTAKLPKINLKYVDIGIGKTTEQSITSGVLNGIIGGINETVKMIKKEMKIKDVTIIFTGGEVNPLVIKRLNEKRVIKDSDFTLKGFKLIYDMNVRKR